jgi:hypothetical protein
MRRQASGAIPLLTFAPIRITLAAIPARSFSKELRILCDLRSQRHAFKRIKHLSVSPLLLNKHALAVGLATKLSTESFASLRIGLEAGATFLSTGGASG